MSIENYQDTCSVDHPRNGCLTFARTEDHLMRLLGRAGLIKIGVCIPQTLNWERLSRFYGFVFFPLEFCEYEFTLIHNRLHRYRSPKANVIGENCDIHSSVIYGEGIHVAVGPEGKKAHLHHIGNVVIEDDVFIGPFCLVQRGTFDSTKIGKGVKIDSNCIIGHNSVIGENSVLSHCILGGSVKIGKNCWIGMGAIVRNGISICDNVVVGQGANVVKDITEPGIYCWNPAKYFGPVPDGWNF